MNALRPIVVTSGEPAGIGPELCAMLATQEEALGLNRPIVVLGDRVLIEQRAQIAGLSNATVAIDHLQQAKPSQVSILHHPVNCVVTPGKPTTKNAPYVLKLLDQATDLCLNQQAAAMVTAPIQKSVISPILPGFCGHTEYLAERCGTPNVVMMLASNQMKVALATIHLPLSQVPQSITPHGLLNTLSVLLQSLTQYWARPKPRILVCGLNPHAGEQGDLGREEIEIITPVIQQLQDQGHDVQGPFPADTLFQPKYLKDADAVLAMYHDQGLPVLKYASFGEGVNITLGLPIIRTSVDHGTALDLAGTGNMNPGSLIEAICTAHQMDLSQGVLST